MPKRRTRTLGALSVSVVLFLSGTAIAEEEKKPTTGGPYGWQVMSEEEKAGYVETLKGLSTPEDRAVFRVEHREKMDARAREQGVDISERPGRRKGGERGEARGQGGRGGRGEKKGRGGQRGAGGRRPVGWEIMSEEERGAYKQTLQSLESREERTAFREEHSEKMQARAKEQGVTLRTPGAGKGQRGGGGGQEQLRIYGEKLMTEEERVDYADKVRSFKTLEERKEFRQDHVVEMRRRAKEQGVTLPPLRNPSSRRRGVEGGANGGGEGE